METDDLSSVEMERLDKRIIKSVSNIWIIIIFYIICIVVTVSFMVVKDNLSYARFIGSLAITLWFIALLTVFLLRKYDSSLHELKTAIKIRKKKKQERDKTLALLVSNEQFSKEEKQYFKNYNSNGSPRE